ncbi:MAG: YicC/YloC family endoribonuclease [Pseudomonadota bacterium]
MTVSMTGFAARQGAFDRYSWSWDVRSVNGRGLDLRLRMPDWIEGLEQSLRAKLQASLHRGSVQVSLRLSANDDSSGPVVNDEALETALSMIAQVKARADARGVEVSAPSAAEVLAMRGVLDGAGRDDDTGPLKNALEADFDALLEDLVAMRASEGSALHATLEAQIAEVETLHAAACSAVADRNAAAPDTLRDQLARVLAASDGVDPDRLTQEIALLAVKSDVTEELDRLTAHIAAARALLTGPGPKGRKLDFLIQEFNREANTLCSKSGTKALTAVGLDLKAVIDQMREQVQNVE